MRRLSQPSPGQRAAPGLAAVRAAVHDEDDERSSNELPPVHSFAQVRVHPLDDDADDRSLAELQTDLEALRAPRRRSSAPPVAAPPSRGRRGASKQQRQQSRKAASGERVVGHNPMLGRGATREQVDAVSDVQRVIADLTDERRQNKRKAAAEVYRTRRNFPPDADRRTIRAAKGGTDFLDKHFGVDGNYVPRLQEGTVTPSAILQRLGGSANGFELVHHASTGQTRILHHGVPIYALHRGASAFQSVGHARASGRQVLSKRGSSREYVRDDRGVPVGRFGYAVKGGKQVELMKTGTALRGRFVRDEHPTFGKTPRTVMSGSIPEMTEIGAALPPAPARFGSLTEDQMLFLHQEYGSGDRQRGVSISSSPTPLLSNEARGFADNSGERKVRIDFSTVPRREAGEAPNLVDLHQRRRGFEHRRVVVPPSHEVAGMPAGGANQAARLAQYDAAVAAGTIVPGNIRFTQGDQQKRFDWSVAKNREMYLSRLSKQNLRGWMQPSPLDRTNLAGMGPDDYVKEIGAVHDAARAGERTVPPIELRKPRRRKKQTRVNRGGPKGRKH